MILKWGGGMGLNYKALNWAIQKKTGTFNGNQISCIEVTVTILREFTEHYI